jgi:hypothetical protein
MNRFATKPDLGDGAVNGATAWVGALKAGSSASASKGSCDRGGRRNGETNVWRALSMRSLLLPRRRKVIDVQDALRSRRYQRFP